MRLRPGIDRMRQSPVRCVDLEASTSNCGSCGHQCAAAGAACTGGTCSDEVAVLGSFAGPIQITGGSPTTTCIGGNEAVPEYSLTAGDADFAVAYNPQADPQGSEANWADAWPSAWGGGCNVPVATAYSIRGDPWTTTSGGTGLFYFSYLLNNPSPPGGNSIGIAATTPNNLDVCAFTFPATSINPSVTTSDGPAIYFDPAAANLWVAEYRIGVGFLLYLLSPCNFGQPGSSGCPIKSGFPVTFATATAGHPNVIVNPCTGHAIVPYHDNGWDVRIRFYTATGSAVGSNFLVDALPPGGANTNCNGSSCAGVGTICKCTGVNSGDCGSNGCMRMWNRVHASVKVNGTQCLLALSYESPETASDGNLYEKGHWSIVNITNESAPSLITTRDSSASSFVRNEFEPTVSFNAYTNGFGFFFYRQANNNPCTTQFLGYTNVNLGQGAVTYAGPFTPNFPTMRFATALGLGDYVEIVRRGLPGGYLFPSWNEPVALNPGLFCRACQGVEYSNRAMAARVTP